MQEKKERFDDLLIVDHDKVTLRLRPPGGSRRVEAVKFDDGWKFFS